jgi:hypothetical protein
MQTRSFNVDPLIWCTVALGAVTLTLHLTLLAIGA